MRRAVGLAALATDGPKRVISIVPKPQAKYRPILRGQSGWLGLPFFLLLILLSATLPSTVHAAGVETTWNSAQVALPGNVFGGLPVLGRWRERRVQQAIAGLDAETKLPAIIFLHGCAGIGSEEEAAKLLFLENGFAVFVPDSFARVGRRSTCRTDSFTATATPDVNPYRQEEIAFAIEQVRAQPWIDGNRIIAVGFSEGGMALARYPKPGLAAAIITAWHCHGTGDYFGLKLPPSVPVLAIIGNDDPWYAALKDKHCGLLFDGRAKSESIVLPDNGHNVMNSRNVANVEYSKSVILDFIQR